MFSRSTIPLLQSYCHMSNRRSHIPSLAVWVVALFITAALGARPATAVEVKTVISPGGIQALLVEDHSNPIIAMRIAFRGGSALDPDDMAGLANLVASTIDEGAGPYDSQAFQRRLEEFSIRLRFNASKDDFRGTLTTLSKNKEEAFRLLRLALTEPKFDREPVNRIRSQIQAGLRNESQDPDSIAGKLLFKKLFTSHPYGNPTNGTEETVSAITLPAMRKFVTQRFARDNLIVGVTGDISTIDLQSALDQIFGALPEKAKSWRIDRAQVDTDGAIHVEDVAVSQSSILFAQSGMERSHDDFFGAYVLNYILGGGTFVSRLYNEVREKRGLAYSAYSYLSTYDHAALIIGGAGTANESVSETIQVVRDQWRDVRDNGVSEEELRNAKTYLTGSYPLRFSSSAAIANMLVGIQLENLGADYFDRRNSYVEQVTLGDVNRIAKSLLDPDSLTFIVAGQPEGIPNVQ